MHIGRRMRALTLVLSVTVVRVIFARTLAAQQPTSASAASPYVPVEHWTMPYVEHLIALGTIRDPTPLTRPLRRADLVAALRAADTVRASVAIRRTVRRLLAEFRDPAGDHYRVQGSGGVAAATEPLRDPLAVGRGVPLMPMGPSRAFVSADVALTAQFGPFVAATHPIEDTRLRFDPQWYDSRRNGLRIAEAYLSAQGRYGEVFFGILDRNWGPSGIPGLLLSDNPYNLDHLYIRVGTPALQIQAIATELDPATDSTGAAVNRFMLQHRVYVHPRGRWSAALWEGSVWSGVGRQAEPWYLNPLNVGLLVQGYGAGNVNNLLGVDVERRGVTTLFAQLMLDDIQYERQFATDLKPASYGLTLGAKGRVGGGVASWTAFYTQVANLTYRNEDDFQIPLFHGLGTGRNFADYDQATLKLGVLTPSGVLLQPELTLLRQGEGDPRLPHPLPPAYPTTATLFQGVVERTWRMALGADWHQGRWGVRGNGGVHFVSNAGHLQGASDTRWVGSVRVSYSITWEGRL